MSAASGAGLVRIDSIDTGSVGVWAVPFRQLLRPAGGRPQGLTPRLGSPE